MNTVPPKERDIAMVFQNYALYPHMTVDKNMALRAKLRGARQAEIDERVNRAAEILELEPYLDRYPRQLSGGQRQRVAMGRAIVRDPQVFLFDEPLSNLDAKLRVQMRTEIKELHQRLRTTTIYVTHDQIEAMTMGDKIVVMHEGRVEQIGTPLELYDHPDNLFVAGFIGSPAMNFLHGTLRRDNGAAVVVEVGGRRPDSRLIARIGQGRPAGGLRCAAGAFRCRGRRRSSNARAVRRADRSRYLRPRELCRHQGLSRSLTSVTRSAAATSCTSARGRTDSRVRTRRPAEPYTDRNWTVPRRSNWEELRMTDLSRRDVLKAGVAVTAAAAGSGLVLPNGVARTAPAWNNQPESNAQIRVLRWKQFVQGDIDAFNASTKKFTAETGIKVRVDTESWEDMRPKAAVAANVGAGPDIIIGTNDDPHKFPEKLVPLNDLADYLGGKYGGWYDVCKSYGIRGNDWIALPQGVNGSCFNYRISAVRKAGFETFPNDLPGLLKLCQALKAAGTPAGFALGHATGDANNWTHWCLWAHGGKVVDQNSKVVLDSPETIAALEYAKQLADTFISGTLSWQDPHNNKAFLSGDIALTGNGISIYAVAKNSKDPAVLAIAKDMNHAPNPIGPVGRPMERTRWLRSCSNIRNIRRPQRNICASCGRRSSTVRGWQHPTASLAAAQGLCVQPDLDRRSKEHPYRDAAGRSVQNGYAGPLGYASAAVMGDFIVVDMFAEVCSGNQTAKAAAQSAADRAKRYYEI